MLRKYPPNSTWIDPYAHTTHGYEFLRPSAWVEVKGSGTIFFTAIQGTEENCFRGHLLAVVERATSGVDVAPEETVRRY